MFDFFYLRLSEGLEYFGTAFEFYGSIAEHLDESNPKHAGALGTLLIHQVFHDSEMRRDEDNDVQRSLAERGVSLLEPLGEPRALSRGYHALAEAAGYVTPEATEWFERALAMARKHRNSNDIGHVLRAMGWAQVLGSPDPAMHRQFVKEALVELRGLKHLPVLGQFLVFSGYILEREQRFEEAKVLYLEARQLAEELEDHALVVTSLASLTDASIGLGEVDQAAAYAGEAYRRVEETGLRYLLPDVLGNLGWVALAQGNLEEGA